MLLELHSVALPLPDALQEFTRRRLAEILRPFLAKVSQIEVVIREIHGSPLFDRRCNVTLEPVDGERTIRVQGMGVGSHAAVRVACHSVRQSLCQIWPPDHRMAGRLLDAQADQEAARILAQDDDALLDPCIRVTTLDDERLRRLIGNGWPNRDCRAGDALLDELDRAEIVRPESIAPDVVTMNSRVLFRNEDTGETHDVSLVYPADSSPQWHRVSILDPVGTALLGLAAGQTIDWPLLRRQRKRLQVMRLLYQPEAAGHLHR